MIINLSDGSAFEVKFLAIKSKTNSFYAKSAYSELNHIIAILDGWKATEKVVEDTKNSTDASAEMRRYKHDGIITQEEFEAKKKIAKILIYRPQRQCTKNYDIQKAVRQNFCGFFINNSDPTCQGDRIGRHTGLKILRLF
ncbi:hypothetical protein [Lactobacillus bombicola]|uniref:hypothetical protein n=1 Tax=Lactobacillus bombicola TaxID=1505723 RepID=UPI000E587026|nr:hypothetical protein [Lactobacillus bombicola]RHW51082.1 hypothetical protein DS833_03765 [Lactobacillus bombicola]